MLIPDVAPEQTRDAETRDETPGDDDGSDTCIVVRVGDLRRVIEVRDHDEVVFGRAPDCTVVVDDDRVSRRHLAVRWRDGALTARDLGSRNGSLLNGRPLVGERGLSPGDELACGPARATVLGGPRRTERLLGEYALWRRLLEEVERAARFRRALALIGLRVEGASGAAAEAIAARLGRIEYVGEWAPGLFVAILPESDRARATQVAGELERAARAVGATATVLGVAAVPEDGTSPDQLVGVALGEAAGGNESARDEAAAPPSLVVADPAMERALELARRAAQSDLTVLVLGETGVGKELVAAEIHRNSARRAGPFVRINCAALPASLVEAELFGHERGAFTGADRRRVGIIESAHGGTLLLDEVGELPAAVQAKLLRVLEERRLSRVGSTEEVRVDVRFVAATHRDLEAEVRRGAFREDLYFRLSAFVLEVPPLRERPRDLAPLAAAFAQKSAARLGRPAPSLTPAFVEALRRYPWPGNVRELRNVIERAVVLAEGSALGPEHLPERLGGDTPRTSAPPGELPARIDELERQSLVEALRATNGNRTHAARHLGISRRALLYKLKKHGLGD